MRLYDLYQKYCDDVSWMCVEPLVVLLSLENVDQVPALNRNTCDVEYLILSLLLMIWWVWDFELLLVPLIVNLHEAKLWEAVLKSDAIESDAPDLHPD